MLELNKQLQAELRLVTEEFERLQEDDRRAEPLSPSASEHAGLAVRHLAEAVSRAASYSCTQVWNLCTPSARGNKASTPAVEKHGLLLDVDGHVPETPILGEDGANEAHVERKLRRTMTARHQMLTSGTASSTPETAHAAGTGERARHAQVPEDKPEAVAALRMWCPTHISKQVTCLRGSAPQRARCAQHGWSRARARARVNARVPSTRVDARVSARVRMRAPPPRACWATRARRAPPPASSLWHGVRHGSVGTCRCCF